MLKTTVFSTSNILTESTLAKQKAVSCRKAVKSFGIIYYETPANTQNRLIRKDEAN